MLVPRYWAEVRVQHRERRKQITVRRMGWSDLSVADAQSMAERRAEEALKAALDGANRKTFLRREPKVPYNGAEGVPIREEIIETRGEHILTRNSYGALCLNTPNVMFADIDRQEGAPWGWIWGGMGVLALTAAAWVGPMVAHARPCDNRVMLVIATIFGVVTFGAALGRFSYKAWKGFLGGEERMVERRVEGAVLGRPGWHVRMYRTPNGWRLLTMHATVDPKGDTAKEFFEAVGSDPFYVQMCKRQNCFRARVSPKPWRAGIERMQSPTWPVEGEFLLKREAWVARYNQAHPTFSSCRYMRSFGDTQRIDADCEEIRGWHDGLSRALDEAELA